MAIDPGPLDPAELRHFLDTFMYRESAFLVDAIEAVDEQARRVEARLDTTRALPFSREQRNNERHPAHVAGAELVMVTGCLGCMHAWWFHGCRWDEGWVGFGNRIHRADFRQLAHIGPPVHLVSQETRSRVGPRRVVLRFEFSFEQKGQVVYRSEQSAMFVKDRPLV